MLAPAINKPSYVTALNC